MRKKSLWILAVLGFLVLFPIAACGALTNTAYCLQVLDNAQTANTAQDALTVTGTPPAIDGSNDAIISFSAENTCDAAGWADGFPAITTKTDAGTVELTINLNDEKSSWFAPQTVAIMLGSEGRANATKLDATLVTVSSTIENDYDNPLMTTETAWEGQHRSNAQITPTTANLSPTDETSTAAINRNDEAAVMTAQTTDQANRVGQNVGSEEQINQKSLYQNPRPEVQHNVIKPIFNGLTRA